MISTIVNNVIDQSKWGIQMKITSKLTIGLLVSLMGASTALAANDNIQVSYQQCFDMYKDSYTKASDGVSFYFGGDMHPPALSSYGNIKSYGKTNAFAKDPQQSCCWVLMSRLQDMGAKAKKLGGNAVINISSYNTDKQTSDSSETFNCSNGFLMSATGLSGEVVKIP